MGNKEGSSYGSSAAVDSAIKDAAGKAAITSGKSKDDHITFALFDRFLCRLFSEQSRIKWVLKGGTGMLSRNLDARATKDIDLYASLQNEEVALAQLIEASSIDLGDHLSFDFRSSEPILVGDQAPHLKGLRVTFQTRMGAIAGKPIKIDLALGVEEIDDFDLIEPEMRLNLPKLTTYPFNVYSVVRQLADKYCAAITVYPHGPSTRPRDLFDIVFLVKNNAFTFEDLCRSRDNELKARQLEAPGVFIAPKEWERTYVDLAASSVAFEDVRTLAEAEAVVNALMNPSEETPKGSVWDPKRLKWSSTS